MNSARKRLIPLLLLDGRALVKTVSFSNPSYVGDPINTALMFSESVVDELTLLDISEGRDARGPNFTLLERIVPFCSMPLCYGGGISSQSDAKRLFRMGVEKISLNSALTTIPDLLPGLSKEFGSQAVRASLDVARGKNGIHRVLLPNGSFLSDVSPVEYALNLQSQGAGEVFVTSIDREGTWRGPDVDLAREISAALSVPTVINGGVALPEHVLALVNETDCTGIALGSSSVYRAQGQGVLIGIPHSLTLAITEGS